MSRRKRFGEILVESGLLSVDTLESVLEKQRGSGKRLGKLLEEMGIVTENDIASALARQFGFQTVSDIAKHAFSEPLLNLVGSDRALRSLIFPLKTEGSSLYLAMVNPLDMQAIDDLSFRSGLRIVPCVTTPSEIQAAVNRHYLKEQVEEEPERPDWWTVLVVDDQEMVRSAVAAALKKVGYNILQASNGAEGLKAVLQTTPHLVIADTVMPRMDGYEFFRHLQANPKSRNIPVLALSSRSAAEEEAKILEWGYLDFIAKPVNPVRLLARVRRALRITYGNEIPAGI